MDYDQVLDEEVGCILFSLKDIVKNFSKPGGDFIWRNIYGAPLGLVEGPYMKRMNNDPNFAS
jgi:hypothetical protein